MFDRVLCDVPCSSDAAIRKLPQKWATWGTRESQSLHPLQIKLLQRGIETLKVGGKISYSTCSLNPIENEAVVAAILKEYGDTIELLDVELPNFKFQPGLTSWEFMNVKSRDDCIKIEEGGSTESFFDSFDSFDKVPNDIKFNKTSLVIKESMFCDSYSPEIKTQLTKCLRVLPHHQNTSGFFITII